MDSVFKAVDDGEIVHWKNIGYCVIKRYNFKLDETVYYIVCDNDNTVALKWDDEMAVGYEANEFFIGGTNE